MITTTTNISTNTEIFAILILIVFLIMRDIFKIELLSSNNKNSHIYYFVNSSLFIIIPLFFCFLSIIFYRIMLII